MLSPKELANVKFDRAMGRGYKADEVDMFVSQVRDLVNAQEEEKRELENKMLILADKLEEYKKDEESLRAAIIGAQRLANSVMQEAKEKAQAIIDEASAKASTLLDNAKKTIEQEDNRYMRMKREVATFKSKLQHMYKQHLELISNIPADPLPETIPAAAPAAVPMPSVAPAPPVMEDELDQEAQVVDLPLPAPDEEDTQSFSYPDEFQTEELDIPRQDLEDPAEYDEDSRQDYDSLRDNTAGRREPSRFGTLKFGKEFDIKREGGRRKK